METFNGVLTEYVGTKRVVAAKIDRIQHLDTDYSEGGAILRFERGGAIRVYKDYLAKHEPKVGGYYIRYKDGYESWSPASAFEEAYKPALSISPASIDTVRVDLENMIPALRILKRNREMSLAITKLEEAVMWLEKA
jgi:hypothetical protein